MHDDISEEFFGSFFPKTDRASTVASAERAVIDQCFAYVTSRFSAMKYILGTGLDFTLLAQQVSFVDVSLQRFDTSITIERVEEKYPRVTARGKRAANTLSVAVGDQIFGIRKLEELVLKYFVKKNKPSYPSAYVYNSGQWAKYKDLLTNVFSLSNSGRYQLFLQLLAFGNENLPTVSLTVKAMPEVGGFERVLQNYPRSHPDENGGLALQAIAFGYVTTEYKHLDVIAAKVRSGSARQKRIGDIDCYSGDALAVTFEVKDFGITAANAESEIGEFVATLRQTNVLGVVFCQTHEAELEQGLECPNLRLLSLERLITLVKLWDEGKQRIAISGVLHFLANIEQNGSATERLKSFLDESTEVEPTSLNEET